ncbi:MAG: cation diffusion facilitator family transporter [Bryobacteraceae bacterium]
MAVPPLPVANREEKWGRRIALVSVGIGVVLATAKICAGVAAHSTAVVSDGFESAGDVLSSGIVYGGLLLASKPPDAEHPYGHGRYETLAGLAVGALLLLTGFCILWNAFTHFGEPSAIAGFAIYPLLAAILVKTTLALAKFRAGRRIASTSLEADAWHDVTDLISTAIALTATVLAIVNPGEFGVADRIGAMVIGLIIFALSLRVVHGVLGQLLDTMPEPEKVAEIREVASGVPGSLGIEKCFARRTGLRYHVDLHLEVDPDMTVRKSHEVAAEVKHRLKERLHWIADVLVHVEPSDARARQSNPTNARTGSAVA